MAGGEGLRIIINHGMLNLGLSTLGSEHSDLSDWRQLA